MKRPLARNSYWRSRGWWLDPFYWVNLDPNWVTMKASWGKTTLTSHLISAAVGAAPPVAYYGTVGKASRVVEVKIYARSE